MQPFPFATSLGMKRCLLAFIAFPYVLPALAPDAAINGVLQSQVNAWNRGDLAAFMAGYAEDCTFVGKQVLHGREQVQARYQQRYPSAEAMGKLTFSDIQVQPVDEHVATVTGRWRLERSARAGGNIDGLFSLVFRIRDGRWAIILDHTS